MIARRRPHRDADPHAGDWLITYADMITLLLCLFVVLLSVRTHVPAAPGGTVVLTGQEFFGGPSPFPPPRPARAEPRPPAVRTEAPPPEAAAPARAAPSPAMPIPPPMAPAPAVTVAPAPAASDPVPVEPVAPIRAVLEQPPAEPPAARPAPTDGERLRTFQINSAAFFPSGQADLTPEGKALLREVAVTLKAPAYAGWRIAVEGHTDDTPINTLRFQSNWELSTARAAAVVRALLELGLPADRLTAAGYADTFPIAPNRDPDGTPNARNQARNRRVVIRLEKIDRPAADSSFINP